MRIKIFQLSVCRATRWVLEVEGMPLTGNAHVHISLHVNRDRPKLDDQIIRFQIVLLLLSLLLLLLLSLL